MRVLNASHDCTCRTGTCAQGTSAALVAVNDIRQERLTYAGRTAFFLDMCLVLVTEEMKGGQYRVGSGLAQTTQGVGLYVVAEFFQLIKVLHLGSALGNLLQDFQHTLCPDTACGTLAAGFLNRELQEELGNIHHTVILVHDNQTAGTHHGTDGEQVVIVNGDIKVLCRDTSAGRTAGLGSLELLAVWDAAADFLDDRAQCGSHGNFQVR